MSVLLSTAYLDEAERCDEVVLLHEGRVLHAGPPSSLTATMQGRAFAVTAGRSSKRELLAGVAALPGVIDSVIQSDHVRVVTAQAQVPDLDALRASWPAIRIEPLPPRFEDGFIARLRETGRSAHERTEHPATPEVGSSRKRISGSWSRAAPSANRCLKPRGSSLLLRSACEPRPKASSAHSMRAVRRAPLRP